MAWQKLNKYFWNFYGKSRTGLPSGHIECKHIGRIIYLKIGSKIYKSQGKQPWKLVTDKIELIALGENNQNNS